jgi:hypothetical protein
LALLLGYRRGLARALSWCRVICPIQEVVCTDVEDIGQPGEGAHGYLRNLATFYPGYIALVMPDLGPELLLRQAQLEPL